MIFFVLWLKKVGKHCCKDCPSDVCFWCVNLDISLVDSFFKSKSIKKTQWKDYRLPKTWLIVHNSCINSVNGLIPSMHSQAASDSAVPSVRTVFTSIHVKCVAAVSDFHQCSVRHQPVAAPPARRALSLRTAARVRALPAHKAQVHTHACMHAYKTQIQKCWNSELCVPFHVISCLWLYLN